MKKIMLLALLVLSTQIACLSEHQAIPQNKNPNQDTGPADISDDEDHEDEKNEIPQKAT